MGVATRLIAAAGVFACLGGGAAVAGPAEATFAFTTYTNASGSLLLDLTGTAVAGKYVVDGVSGTFSGFDANGLNGYTAAVTGLYTGSYHGITVDNLFYDPAVFGLPVDMNGLGFLNSAGFANVLVTISDPPYYGPSVTLSASGGYGFLSSSAVTIYPNGIAVPEAGALMVLGGRWRWCWGCGGGGDSDDAEQRVSIGHRDAVIQTPDAALFKNERSERNL